MDSHGLTCHGLTWTMILHIDQLQTDRLTLVLVKLLLQLKTYNAGQFLFPEPF